LFLKLIIVGGTHQNSYSMVTMCAVSGVNRQGREPDHIYLTLSLRSRMSGAIHPPIHMPSRLAQDNFLNFV
jgi:hypothetical protein